MSKQQDIDHYGMDVKDLDASPFEIVEMLRLRSKIQDPHGDLVVHVM